ncbi:carboxypeptidase-like regulatory domain-containing protein [Algibacter sp. 2305UL17-15]|uniref:carboxypeptidase-like regulatory domain-containing protein n=1 Tax=Algibacter sp. 2305UL17-15 TaxID=3231268 RepID=UPI003459F26B
MKYFLLTLCLCTAMLTSAQNAGTINGKITDAEEGNTPLLFAKVTVKETGKTIATDENGVFKIENIENGTYTLVCSFTGYETQEIKTDVISGKLNNINLSLVAGTLSLDDLALAFTSSASKDETIKNN